MIDMIIYGTPVGKGRPRFGRGKSGNIITFTPKKTREYEQGVKALAQVAMMNRTLIEGPVKVTITAIFNHKTKTGWHVSRPDVDNIVKAILDGRHCRDHMSLSDHPICLTTTDHRQTWLDTVTHTHLPNNWHHF
jgi:Holliday junction resolvase RusA-like endonuclease